MDTRIIYEDSGKYPVIYIIFADVKVINITGFKQSFRFGLGGKIMCQVQVAV